MATVTAERPTLRLNSPDLIRRVNALRQTDNWRNWFYMLREYLYLGSVVGLAILFYMEREAWGLSWLWNIPVSLLAITLVGAGQHRLTTLAHEASHYMLFRNRKLNELASDFLCMFSVWSTTHHYRLQHMAHHQFPNDPQRDPDVAQMEGSGHSFHFPMSAGPFHLGVRDQADLVGPRPGPLHAHAGQVCLDGRRQRSLRDQGRP